MSRSVWKIEVGDYKDGTKRYEYRHLNDLKFAHPNSLAAPAHRPKLGRPAATTSPSKSSTPTETTSTGATPLSRPTNRLSGVPNPPVDHLTNRSKQTADGTAVMQSHETSSSKDEQPAPKKQDGQEPSRPVRSTRNPAPQYVDAISTFPWSASQSQIDFLNKEINRPRVLSL